MSNKNQSTIELSHLLSEQHCLQILHEKLKTTNFQLLTYKLDSYSQTTYGYNGGHFYLKCVVLDTSGNEVNHKVFVKIKNEATSLKENPLRLFNEYCNMYQKESGLYNLIQNEFQYLNETKKWCPDFYGCIDNRCIALEDVCELGYRKPNNKLLDFDFSHCQAALKAIATLHAVSIKMDLEIKSKEPSKALIDLYPEALVGKMWDKNNKSARDMFKSFRDLKLYVLKTVLNISKSSLENIEKKMDKYGDLCWKDMQVSKRYLNVINHGDLWGNNVLFKYNADNEPIDCCLIDFQAVHYAPPTVDVVFFLTINTTIDFQKKYLQQLLDFYYEQLTEDVKRLSGRDFNELFNKKDFDRSCKDMYVYAKMTAAHFCAILNSKNYQTWMKEYDFFFVDAVKFAKKDLETNEDNYRDKLKYVFEDLYQMLISLP